MNTYQKFFELSTRKVEGRKNMKIHLFQQCLIDMFYPHVGMAGVEVLERLGCDLVVPKKQVCCGQMFTNSGYNDAAMDAIKNTIECFRKR